MYCAVCGIGLRKTNKALEYIGVVCSNCYRMSDKRYYQTVDKVSQERIEFIIKTINDNKVKEKVKI